MQTADFERFRVLMAGMAKIHERELDDVVLDVYWLTLRDWSLDEFEQAVSHLMATLKWMPKPSEFTVLRKVGRPTPGEAWSRAVEYCRSGAWRNGGGCGDPAVDAAARMLGGYEVIALCDTSRLGFVERRFCEHYETLEDATDTRAAVPQVAQDDRPRRLLT